MVSVFLTIKNIHTIKKVVDEAIREAAKHKKEFNAVNWGDIKCVEVRFWFNGDCFGYTAYVEEASPDAAEFREYIKNYLLEKYGYDIEVVTSW